MLTTRIDTVIHTVSPGITLHCRVAGPAGAPTLLFLHGFPEGAFVWDALLAHFSQPEHGLPLRGALAAGFWPVQHPHRRP